MVSASCAHARIGREIGGLTPNPNYISNSLWGVLRGPALGGFRCLPQCREQPAQLLGRERQCIPTLRIPLRQCIAEAPIPSELFPGDRLVNRKVHRNAA